jgi:hypothetical protein
MKLSRFEGRSIGLAGLTTGGVGKAWKAIADKMFAESYILYYGFPQKKIITKTKVFYVDPPLIRGKAIKVATRLLRQPVIAIVNAESSCIDKNLVESVVEDIEVGEYTIYMSIPYTSTELEKLYKEVTNIIYKHIPNIKLPPHPSYSLIVGVKKYFEVEEETLWSYEHLAVLMSLLDGKAKVKVDNSNCKDVVQSIFSGMEKVFTRSLLKSVIKLAIKRKIIEKERGLRVLEEVEARIK